MVVAAALSVGCSSPACLSGSTKCGSVCADLQTDQANCGACGHACSATQICGAGTCVDVPPCLAGSMACGGVCVDVQSDRANCGSCAHACAGDEQCTAGACQKIACSALGLTDCGGACTNLMSDQLHCGSCSQACAANERCVAGSCTAIGVASCGGGMCASCAAIAAAVPGAPSGEYTIDPDGWGGAAPFTVVCEMAAQGGGWTQVTDHLAASLASTTNRQYLYLFGSAGYVSPCSSHVWSWTNGAGQELTGSYAYFGASSGTFSCPGSSEKPSWGVGCSSGPGPTQKLLPATMEDPSAGTSQIWQDSPNAFGSASANPVVIFEKEGCTP
jgi:hypothetical protein